jgi:hypothetical protein
VAEEEGQQRELVEVESMGVRRWLARKQQARKEVL